MASDSSQALQEGAVPSGWTVFRVQKGKAVRRGASDLLWGALFFVGAGAAWYFLQEELSAVVRWIILVVGVLIGLAMGASGVGKLTSAGKGGVVVTETELVVRKGKETRYELSDISTVRLLRGGDHGKVVVEVEIEQQSGAKTSIASTDIFDDVEPIYKTLLGSIGGPKNANA